MGGGLYECSRTKSVDASSAVSEREGLRRRRRLTWNFHGSQAGSPDREAQKWSEQTLLRRAEAERGGSSRDSILCGGGRLEARIALRPRSPTDQTDGRQPPADFENSQKRPTDARCNAHAAARHECAVWPPSAAWPPRLTQSVLWIGDAAAALPNHQMPARLPSPAAPD